MSRKILLGLKLDRDTIEQVSKLVAMHQRANAYEDDWTDGAVRRFIREADEVLEDLLDLSAADVTSQRQERRQAAGARVSALRARIEQIRAEEEVEKLASPLDGNELMALFGRPPGPWIKPIKDAAAVSRPGRPAGAGGQGGRGRGWRARSWKQRGLPRQERPGRADRSSEGREAGRGLRHTEILGHHQRGASGLSPRDDIEACRPSRRPEH